MGRTLTKKVRDSNDREYITKICNDLLQDWVTQQKRLCTLAHSNVAYDDINNLFGTMRKFKTLSEKKHEAISGIVGALIEKSANPEAINIDLSEVTAPQQKFEREIQKHITRYNLQQPERIKGYIDALDALAETRHAILTSELRALVCAVTPEPEKKPLRVKIYRKNH